MKLVSNGPVTSSLALAERYDSSADYVARSSTLLYRRVALGRLPNVEKTPLQPNLCPQRTTSRLKVCDTAELELCATTFGRMTAKQTPAGVQIVAGRPKFLVLVLACRAEAERRQVLLDLVYSRLVVAPRSLLYRRVAPGKLSAP